VQVVNARDGGVRVDDAELDRAVENIASMNKLTPLQLRERLKADGMDYSRFRANLRDQIMSERLREREVQSRIKITDAELDSYLQEQRSAKSAPVELNIAQILVTVPDGASPEVVAQRRAKVDAALARLKAGEPFALVARAVSEDGNRENGGEIGAKPIERLPDLFVDAVKTLPVGALAPTVVRSGAGFHLLKLLSRSEPSANLVTETRARHILLRLSPGLTAEDAQRRLAEFRGQVLAGKRRFDELAREYSDDGSAAAGGDLGWAAPGMFVPEFEQAMNALSPGGISAPVVSRFGVHLIQVMERRQVPVDPRQQREAARAVLRERKFEPAYVEWLDDLRSRTFIELREPPL
jgi:peptidyl-prolyl cis-trans isomerase SurA